MLRDSLDLPNGVRPSTPAALIVAGRVAENRLRVLAPTRYPWRFNGPRASRHIIENRNFLPLNRISERIEGTTVFNPWPPRRFDLVHAFNRVPLGTTPFVIGFESHLPRAFGLEGSRYQRALTRMIAGPRCRRIVAISEHARRQFLHQHGDSTFARELMGKLVVRPPNLPMPAETEGPQIGTTPFRVAFVGNHFARKGGCVAVRLAAHARAAGLPIEVEIVSALQMGRGVWTDPTDERFFDPYRAGLTLPNVRWHRTLDNVAVHTLLARSHLSLLTTFSDTFGYSAVESMAHGTPVIATAQGALPEFIHPGNGVLLDLPVSPLGEWVHLGRPDRNSQAYAATFAAEIERLAREALAAIASLVADPARYRALRRAARADTARIFSSPAANRFWDELYAQAVVA